MNYVFEKDIAKVIGVRESIILSTFAKQIEWNEATENVDAYFGEKYWVIASMENLHNLFPFWTFRQVQIILESLMKTGLLEKVVPKIDNLNGKTRYTILKGKQFDDVFKTLKMKIRTRKK